MTLNKLGNIHMTWVICYLNIWPESCCLNKAAKHRTLSHILHEQDTQDLSHILPEQATQDLSHILPEQATQDLKSYPTWIRLVCPAVPPYSDTASEKCLESPRSEFCTHLQIQSILNQYIKAIIWSVNHWIRCSSVKDHIDDMIYHWFHDGSE